MLRYMRAEVMHFSFSKNMGFCGRLEEDEFVNSGDLHFRGLLPRARAACVCAIRASTVWKFHRSFMSWKHSVVETRGEWGGERRVCACKLPSVIVAVDRFATGTKIGYYLGRKSI